ncbi:MAG TPA: adenylate/guanylate cyclase domain-containing protein [Acidimicrobiales bacterium]|nr:adenylate/guanylate cyclase domain-containing protein [Acidimicrobiales bacterium]
MAEEKTGSNHVDEGGSQPRAMIMFCDLVGSTELSGRHEPERYGLLVRRYIAEIRKTVEDRFGGDVVNEEGDGLLALFGAPRAHGDDAERAVRAALEVIKRVGSLAAQTEREMGEALAVRVAIHRGQIFRTTDDSVYGLAANLAARLQTLASPNEVVVSEEVRRLIGDLFEIEAGEPQMVKGVADPVRANRVIGEAVDRNVARRPRGPLVNRDREWGLLRDLWNKTREGGTDSAVALLLRGEAGVGKSYLASRVASMAGDEGASVVELAGSAFFENAGLYPVRRLMERTAGVRRAADGVERLQLLRGELLMRGLSPEVFVPRLAPILGLEPATGYEAEPLEPRRLNEDIQEAAFTYIDSCLGDQPSVLVVEDIHWLDSSTRELVHHLAGVRRGCVLIMTARPGFEPFRGVEVIELEPFSEQDSGRLVDALCSEAPIAEDIRTDVVSRCDGIPLYIEELVVNVQQGVESLSEKSNGRSSGRVPDLLYDLLAARLASPSDVIPVATASAVIGREVDRRLLQTVLDVPDSELERSLEILCLQGVLEPRDGGERQYRFRHELLREVAYELQPPSRRRSVHGRLADALASGAGGSAVVDWAVVAPHYELAERPLESAEAYERAASAARLRGAFGEARRHLTKAIDLLTSGLDHSVDRDIREVRLRLQRGYIAVSEEGHASPAAASDYQQCLELSNYDPLGDDWFNTVIVLWTYHVIRGELSRARKISESTYKNLEKREWYRPFNIAALGILDCWGGDFRAAVDLLEFFDSAREEADEDRFLAAWFNPNEPVTAILNCLSLVRFVTGNPAGAEEAFDIALERTEAMNFPLGPYSATYALSLEAWMRMERKQFDKADASVSLLNEIATRHGFDGWTMVGVTQQSTLAALRSLERGDDRASLAAHASTLAGLTNVWKQFDTRFFLPYYLNVAGVLYAASGDDKNARALLQDSLAMTEETGMNFWRSEALRHLANLEPDPVHREEGLRQAIELAREQHACLFELRIAIDLADASPTGARQDLEAALDRLGTDEAYPEVARALGILAGAR